MRLTNLHRDTFVRGVMNDTPKTDYDEQARKLIQEAVIEKAPQKVRELYEDKDLRAHLVSGLVYTNDFSIYIYGMLETTNIKNIFPELVPELEQLGKKRTEQRERLRSLESKLYSQIKAYNTLKQAKDAMPELAKYLPEEPEKKPTQNVPQCANLIADLVSAGWPKKEAA